jgi:hypothetical protein
LATSYSQQIVQKLWNYYNLLRDDGLFCGEQLKASIETGFRRAKVMRQTILRQAFGGRHTSETTPST